MVVDGADPREVKPKGVVRPSWSRGGGPVQRGWPHNSVRPPARTRPLPPPPTTTFASLGRQERRSGVSRARRGFGVHGDGAERDQAAAAAGGNAAGDLVGGGGAERCSGLPAGVLAREVKGSGGGAGGFGLHRGLAPAASPPPKRRALSPTRRFPPVSGREPAAPVVRAAGEDSLRVGSSTSHGGFGSEEGVLLPAVLDKVVPSNGGASVSHRYPHCPKAMVGKASHASLGNAGLSEINGAGGFFGSVVDRGARSNQLRNKHLGTLPAVGAAHDCGSVSYRQRQSAMLTLGATMDVDGAEGGQELEEGEIADTMEVTQGMIRNDALSRPMEHQELEEGQIVATMDVDGAGGGQELEEGEIADTMEVTQGMIKNDAFSRPMEHQELEEGQIAATIDNVEDMNNNVLDGPVEGRILEEGAAMNIVGVMVKEDFDGPVDGHEFEQGVIAATMTTVESMNNQDLHGVVVVVQELEKSEITALDIVEGTDKDKFVEPVKDRELEDEIVAKGHCQEPDDGDIATKSDHTAVQQSHFSVDVIPRDSTGSIVRSKIKFTAKKTVQPPVKANHMSQLVTLDRPFSSTSATTMKKFKAAQSKSVPMNAPQSKPVPMNAGQSKHVPMNLASTSAFAKEKRKFEPVFVSEEKLNGKTVTYLEDDDILKAVAVHGGKLQLCRGAPSRVRSVLRHRPRGGGQNADLRIRVRMMCRRFQFLCRFLAQAVKQGLMELPRVDLAADHVIKDLPDYIKYGSIVGEVDGVEVGDEFLFRVELAIVGLHNPYRSGIDTTKDTDGEFIAVSIVASGGYLDEYSSSGELIYIGSGGKAAGTDQDGDQKLERGNLALKNCIKRKIPVRVTHGFKTPNREGSHSIGKEIPNFIYDGLYHVVGFWQEGIPGSRVFKYRLQRVPGQPELGPRVAKWLRKSVVRPR